MIALIATASRVRDALRALAHERKSEPETLTTLAAHLDACIPVEHSCENCARTVIVMSADVTADRALCCPFCRNGVLLEGR